MDSKIEERLWVSARYLAKENGMDYSVPCSTIVRDLIRAGTRNMVRENRTSEPDFEEADLNLARLVEVMIAETKRIPNTPAPQSRPLIIREAAFVKSKVICPLWPYC